MTVVEEEIPLLFIRFWRCTLCLRSNQILNPVSAWPLWNFTAMTSLSSLKDISTGENKYPKLSTSRPPNSEFACGKSFQQQITQLWWIFRKGTLGWTFHKTESCCIFCGGSVMTHPMLSRRLFRPVISGAACKNIWCGNNSVGDQVKLGKCHICNLYASELNFNLMDSTVKYSFRCMSWNLHTYYVSQVEFTWHGGT